MSSYQRLVVAMFSVFLMVSADARGQEQAATASGVLAVACSTVQGGGLQLAATGGRCSELYGPGWYDCITYFCNTEGIYCCPPGYPYLNHCDCLCYAGTNFPKPCSSYSNCAY